MTHLRKHFSLVFWSVCEGLRVLEGVRTYVHEFLSICEAYFASDAVHDGLLPCGHV